MGEAERGQSETIGTLLMTAIVVIATSLVGVALLTAQAQQIEATERPSTFDTSLDSTSLTITHSGGRAFPLDELDLVLRQGDTEIRYDLDDPGDRRTADIDGDDRFEGGESITVSHSFVGDVRVFLVDTSAGGHLLYDETKALDGSVSAVAPTIVRFDINDTSSGGNASFEVTWNASDEQGDITRVTLELVNNGTVEDSTTTTFARVASTGVNTDTLANASGGGEVYEIRLTVSDAFGHTATRSTADTADNEIGLRPPTIETFEATDTTGGNQVSYEYTYNASDPDGDLVEVNLELIEESSGTVVDNVTDTYAEVDTTGVQTGTLVDPAGKKADGATYRINMTVTDLDGNDVTATTTDIADGDGTAGGAGSPPSVDTFTVTDTTNTSNTSGSGNSASFDVAWRASDADGNLANATLKLMDKNGNKVLDSVSYASGDFTNGSDTGTQTATLTDPNGEGKEYLIVIEVTDSEAKTTSASESHLADGDDSGTTP